VERLRDVGHDGAPAVIPNQLDCSKNTPVQRALVASMRRTLARTAAVTAVAATLAGCEVDSWMDPSRTGYFETTPTTMPILSRLDVIERTPEQTLVAPPTPEDLVPGELKYRLAPGDVVRVEVFELITPGQPEIEERTIDQTGNVRLKEIGDVVAAGLTVEEFQQEIVQKVANLIENPVVSVSLERGQSFQYSISGSIGSAGVFTLTRPDFRLSEAIAQAGGTLPTTQRVTVIRAAPLDDTLNPVYPERQATPTAKPADTTTTKPEQPAVDIESLINELEGGKKDDGAKKDAAPSAAPGGALGMVGDTPRTLGQDDKPAVDIDELATPKTDAPEAEPQAAPSSGFTFDTATGRWVRGTATTRNGGTRGARPAPAPRQSMYATRVIEIDYQQLVKGDPNLDVVIRPSDRIYVEPPETGFLYIDGEINRIGVYNLENTNGRLTLSRFISAAGGLSPTAIPNRVDLVRVVGKDREATIRVDLAAIRNRTEPDIYMEKDDHIIIGTNFFATPLAVIRNGFRMTYGFGFLLDRNFGNDVFGPPPQDFGQPVF
jgi:polysaccharide export outer membrane protein